MTTIDINKVKSEELIPGFSARFAHSKNMTFAHWDIMAGATLPEHSHIHEQVAFVVKGKFTVTIDGVINELSDGMMAVIPSNTPHSAIAITDCYIIDTFYPVREDYL